MKQKIKKYKTCVYELSQLQGLPMDQIDARIKDALGLFGKSTTTMTVDQLDVLISECYFYAEDNGYELQGQADYNIIQFNWNE